MIYTISAPSRTHAPHQAVFPHSSCRCRAFHSLGKLLHRNLVVIARVAPNSFYKALIEIRIKITEGLQLAVIVGHVSFINDSTPACRPQARRRKMRCGPGGYGNRYDQIWSIPLAREIERGLHRSGMDPSVTSASAGQRANRKALPCIPLIQIAKRCWPHQWRINPCCGDTCNPRVPSPFCRACWRHAMSSWACRTHT